MGLTHVGELGKPFSEYLTWDHFYTHFRFIQVTISIIVCISVVEVFLARRKAAGTWRDK